MLSSADRQGELAQCRELGIARHLVKPINRSDLWDAIVSTASLSRPIVTTPLPKRLEAPHATFSPLKILLAEDNDINQKLGVRMLEKMGHQVRVAETGEEVLQILDAEPIDLVLMDVQMPIMDGFTATKAIRQKEKAGGPHLPIIAMTAHALKGDRERCLTRGMDGYVAKPVMPKTLAEEIEAVIKKRLRK
jgi:two-component system, sensor histidine kinase and response regulator